MSLCVSFITGQSNKNSCALSPAQEKFLRSLNLNAIKCQPNNFPYSDNMSGFDEVGIIKAGISNTRQYLSSRNMVFANDYRERVNNLIDSHSGVLFLAGSCGLELLNNLRLSSETLNRVQVLAYGPVARSYGETKLTIVQGRRDYLSKLYFSSAHYQVDCGHMDYLQSTEFLEITQSIVQDFAQGRS